MIKESLFDAEEREAKLDKLGDILQVMEQHVDFASLAARIDQAAPRQGGRPPLPKPARGSSMSLRALNSWVARRYAALV